MKVLCIDTSQLQASVVLLEINDNGSAKIILSNQGSTSVAHSESLMSLIQETIDQKELESVDAFAVGVGPGSFTGIRIGMATAKAFAQVFDKKIISFSSLRALYLSFCTEFADDRIIQVAAPNAYQGLVFAGYFSENDWIEEAVLPEELVFKIKKEYPKCDEIKCFGNGFSIHETRIKIQTESLKLKITAENKHYINEIGILKAIEYEVSKVDFLKEINAVEANYLRASQAELKLNSLLAKK